MPRRRRAATQPKGSQKPDAAPATTFEPKHPLPAAIACFTVWIGLLLIPMLSGQFLAASYNDQYSSGYAYRAWAAEWWKTLGHVPLWNPEIFGGMPFVGGMHGDVLYPTAWLRLVMPTHVAMNLGFVVHYVLAALFTYWFLRRWRVSWTGAVVGGVAYQLAGVVGSYVSPGHDGKLFVTTMLPLMLTGLTLGVRDRRHQGYALAALAVGLIMLSPHPQMAQYALLAAGLFTLYLVFGEGTRSANSRSAALALSAAAVALGIGVSAIQYLPFYAYIPFSPRDASVLHDFAWSAAYAIPWSHVPELVIPRFAGESFTGSYSGPNGLKLHSEYLGAIVVALAIVGAMDSARRRMIVWLGAIGLLFMLIALGSATPFFRLWWEVVPFSKSMRAPGMAVFVVAFVTSVLAALGVDRLAAGGARRFAPVAIVAGVSIAVLGAGGVLGAVPASALGAGVLLAIAGGIAVARQRAKIGPRVWAAVMIALVGTDLWLNDKPFWQYSNVQDELFAGDAIKAHLSGVKRPFRVWDVDAQGIPAVYPGAALMADDIPQLYGHHGNEPHTFDLLSARVGSSLTFARAGDPRILDLFAVNYLIVQAQAVGDSLPGFRRVVSNVATSSGAQATLLERRSPIGYARFVPAFAVVRSSEEAIAAVLAPTFDPNRVVVLDSMSGLTPSAVPATPPPGVSGAVSVVDWQPGGMRVSLGAGAPSAGYVLVSENWDAEWRARVDGRDAPVMRGDGTLITVPVPAGAREVVLRYEGRAYARGRLVTIVSLIVVLAGLMVPNARRWRQTLSS
jgi:hypothetical protein